MDIAAINQATDEEVMGIVGLSARGDLIALRSFCAFQSSWDKDLTLREEKRALLVYKKDDRIPSVSIVLPFKIFVLK